MVGETESYLDALTRQSSKFLSVLSKQQVLPISIDDLYLEWIVETTKECQRHEFLIPVAQELCMLLYHPLMAKMSWTALAEIYETALNITVKTKNLGHKCYILMRLGIINANQGRHQYSEENYRDVLDILRQNPDKKLFPVPSTLFQLGHTLTHQAKFAEAIEVFSKCISHFTLPSHGYENEHQLYAYHTTIMCYVQMASIATYTEDFEQADKYHDMVWHLITEIKDAGQLSRSALYARGKSYLLQNKFELAAVDLEQAIKINLSLDDMERYAPCAALYSLALIEIGGFDNLGIAKEEIRKSTDIATRSYDIKCLTVARYAAAKLQQIEGNTQGAIQLLEIALNDLGERYSEWSGKIIDFLQAIKFE